MGRSHDRGMTEPAPQEDLTFRVEELTLRRRRLLAAAVTVAVLTAVAGGSALGAVVGAHDERGDTVAHVVVEAS